MHAEFVAQTIGTQAEKARIPHADGTVVPTRGQPEPELLASLLAASDVLGTGWFAAVTAEAGPGKTVAVVWSCSSPASTPSVVPRRCAGSYPI